MYTLYDTDFEPPFFEYSDIYSWHGEKFRTRPNQHSRASHIDSLRNTKFDIEPEIKTKAVRHGVFVIAESVAVLDDYLQGSPRNPFRLVRRLVIIVITNTNEPNFDELVRKLLRKLWRDYGMVRVVLITPCNNDPEVKYRLVANLQST